MNLILPRPLTFKTKFAILSYNPTEIQFLEKVCLFAEYAQIAALIVIMSSKYTDMETINSNTTLFYILKAFCPGYLLRIKENDNDDVVFWFFFMLILLLLKYLFLTYTVFRLIKGLKLNKVLTKIWSFIFLSQGRVLFLFTSSFSFSLIQAANNQKLNFTTVNYLIIIVCIVLIIIEYLISLVPMFQYSCCLPTKQYLSTKSNAVEIINLTQKMLLQTLDCFLPAESLLVNWIIVLINITFSVFRDLYYFKFFPPYKLSAFYFQGFLGGVITSLALLFLSLTIINSSIDNKHGLDFALIIWLIIIPIILFLYYVYMNKSMFDLLSQPLMNCSPITLMHKICIIKEVRKNRKQSAPKSKKNTWLYFLFGIININFIKNSTKAPDQAGIYQVGFNIDEKEKANRLFLMCLEMIATKFPRNHMLKLYIAYYYGMKLKLYGLALKLLHELKNSCSSKISFNIFFLEYQIQKDLKSEEKDPKSSLNLSEYFNSFRVAKNLKQAMISQAELQLSLLRECKMKSPDLAKIMDCSQAIDQKKHNVINITKDLFQQIPDCYLEPHLIYADYSLKLNYSFASYLNYKKAFTKKYDKYQSFRKSSKLCQENLYDNNKLLFILEMQKEKLGSIVYCSGSFEKILGWESKELMGRNVSAFLPPMLSNSYLERLKMSIESNENTILNKIFRSFMMTKQGYLQLMDFYFDFHPFLSNGIYIDLVLRPVNTSTQYLFVDKNGIVQSTTELFARKFNLTYNDKKSSSPSKASISQLSKELNSIDKSCDMIANMVYQGKIKPPENLEHDELISPNKTHKPYCHSILDRTLETQIPSVLLAKNQRPMVSSLDQALTLYEDSKLQGQTISLTLLKDNKLNVAYRYEVKARLKFYSLTYAKIFSFDELKDTNVSLKSPSDQMREQRIIQDKKEFENNQKVLDVSGSREDKNLANNSRRSFSNVQAIHTSEELSKREMNSNRNLMQADTQYAVSTKIATYNEEKKPENSHKQYFRDKSMSPNSDKAIVEIDGENENEHIYKIKQSLGSQRSKMSEQMRISEAFKDALDLKYYSKVHNVSFLIFYFILLLFFIDNLAIQFVSTHNLETLGKRREIVESAESINDLLTRIHRNVRFIMNFELRKLDEDYFALYNNSRKTLFGRINDDLNSIKEANRNLMQTAGSLDKDDREKIMENNIILFQTDFGEYMEQSFKLNTFQSTFKLYGSGIKGVVLAQNNVSEALPDFYFILRNALNNFLSNSEMISDLFLSVSEKETNASLDTLTINLGIVLLFLALLSIMSSTVIIRQYKADTRNLSSFVKLNSEALEQVATQIYNFKSLLQSETCFEDVHLMETPEYFGKLVKGAVKSSTKSRESETPNYKVILRRYLFLVAKAILALLIIASLHLGGYLQKKDAFDFVFTKLKQVHFSRRMISKANLAVTTYLELFSENNSTLILNLPTAIQIKYSMDTVKSIITRIPKTFKDSGLASDQVIQSVLFDDGCQLLLPDQSAFARCVTARKGKDHVSFMSLLSEVDVALEAVNDRFYQSNRTTKDLCRILTEAFTEIVIPNRVISDLGKMIANTLGQAYEDNISDILRAKNTYDVIVGVLIAVISFMVWISVFKHVREANNNFKKVLKTLPISIITSSFMLKTYLLKSSKDALNFIKSDL